MTPAVLGALALLLAGPGLGALARLPVLRRTPAAALVLWQSVALAAVLAALGAGLALAGGQAGRDSPAAALLAGLALAVTLLVVARLLLSGHRVGREVRAIRRRHREQLDVVGGRHREASVRVLEHPVPVAYCLPGMRGSRIVLSSGALAQLPDEELDAVLSHERAHLRARHDLVLEAFTVLYRAFPAGVASRAALAEVGLLVEVLADRAAVRRGHGPALGRALVAMAEGRLPGGALGATGGMLVARVRLLTERGPHRVQAVVLLCLAATVLVLPTVLVVAPWWQGLWAR